HGPQSSRRASKVPSAIRWPVWSTSSVVHTATGRSLRRSSAVTEPRAVSAVPGHSGCSWRVVPRTTRSTPAQRRTTSASAPTTKPPEPITDGNPAAAATASSRRTRFGSSRATDMRAKARRWSGAVGGKVGAGLRPGRRRRSGRQPLERQLFPAAAGILLGDRARGRAAGPFDERHPPPPDELALLVGEVAAEAEELAGVAVAARPLPHRLDVGPAFDELLLAGEAGRFNLDG